MKKKYTCSESHCEICGKKGVDIHHIKSRGSGGGDHIFNLIKLCHSHHREIHQLGVRTFARKYEQFKSFLVRKGWEFSTITKKWYHIGWMDDASK